jgi:hypothetical protein
MRFVDGKFLPQEDKTVFLFGKTGEVLEIDEQHKLPHYAKIVQNSEGKQTCYIRIYQSTPFDPMGPYGRRERNLDTQIKRVSRSTFDFYVTYLKTNNSIYLTKAQRGFLND